MRVHDACRSHQRSVRHRTVTVTHWLDAASITFFQRPMQQPIFSFKLVITACIVMSLQACAVVAVADAAVTVVATGVTVAAKTVGAVADVALPDGDDD